MGIRISGPSVGPVHSTLWSSGRSRNRKHSSLWLIPLAPLIGVLLWNAASYGWVDIVVAVFVALGILGWHADRAEKAKAAAQAEASQPGAPESPARYSNRR